MANFVMLTRVDHMPGQEPTQLEELEKKVKSAVESACPDVDWVCNYAIMGPYDYLDIFTAPDVETAMKVGTIVRTHGNATVQIWPATEWARFKDIARDSTSAA
ncbi:MAG: GYD domain-containing protein [Rhodovibrionaceae bacterium]|nr:GYD domain-containing protein [Rhodovibrionaceae bacterium]